MMNPWLCPILAFLVGSIPFGLIISGIYGVDIRQHGSGNIGATNVLRVLGKTPGVTCLLLDALKGFLPVVLAISIARFAPSSPYLSIDAFHRMAGSPAFLPRESAQLIQVLTGLAAILGHNYSPWLGFRGGKGIATSAGVILALYPFFGICLVVVSWLVLFFTTRYVSVASMGAAIVLPLLTHFGARFHHVDNVKTNPTLWEAGLWNKPLFALSIAIAALAVWRHRSNIRRLMDGTENRFQRKTKTTGSSPSP